MAFEFPVLDKCPGYNLYIGGFIALRRPKALHNCHITHIVSVLDWKFDSAADPLTRGYQHLHIPVDDVEDENLLIWFPRSNAFIHDAFTGPPRVAPPPPAPETPSGVSDAHPGNAVLIHCAMGKSRSATVLIAYLLWQSRQPSGMSPAATINDRSTISSMPDQPFSVTDALMLLRQGRPIAEPNEGFMDQLHLYVDMGCPTTQAELESHRLYKRWMNKRNVEESLRINRAPDLVDIQFEDSPSQSGGLEANKEASLSLNSASPSSTFLAPTAPATAAATSTSNPAQQGADIAVKCRRCRQLLARSAFVIWHDPYKSDPSVATTNPSVAGAKGDDPTTGAASGAAACAHIFLHPLSWMRGSLSNGQLEGRLVCPNQKCGQNVGKFAWQGLRCSCGKWITPAFALARGRIDQTSVEPGQGQGQSLGAGAGVGVGAGAGLRYPPGMRGVKI